MNTHLNYSSLDSILPLPRRVVPYPDEDLLSIIRRSASRMGYEDLRWLLRPEGGRWDIKDTELPLLSSKQEGYHVLQRLLPLPEGQLSKYTLHRFAPLLEEVHYANPRGSSSSPQQAHTSAHLALLSSESQKNYFLPIRFLRVCPLCLQEQECYDRLYWRMQLILYCPHHRILLQEKCPACEAPISALRQSPYSCLSCRQADYRTLISMPIASEHPFYLGELLLLKALDFPIAENTQSITYLARSPLSPLSGVSYIGLLRTITSQLERFFSLRELVLLTMMLQAAPAEDLLLQRVLLSPKRVVAFLLFHWLFLEWPIHFFAFLDVWYSITTPPYMGEESECVRALSRSLFCDPRFRDSCVWLHQAYLHYHQKFRYDPIRIDQLRENVNQLAQFVHQQQKEVSALPREKERDSAAEHEPPLFVPPRLLASTHPYPWESLTSALSRAAKNMNHPCPERLLERPPFTPCTFGSFSSGEPRLPNEVDDPTLAHLLQIPEKHLQYLSCSYLITSLKLPPYDLSRQWVELPEPELRSWLLPFMMNRTTKVCPYCVREPGGYDRLYWNLHGVLSTS
jgi:TniQ